MFIQVRIGHKSIYYRVISLNHGVDYVWDKDVWWKTSEVSNRRWWRILLCWVWSTRITTILNLHDLNFPIGVSGHLFKLFWALKPLVVLTDVSSIAYFIIFCVINKWMCPPLSEMVTGHQNWTPFAYSQSNQRQGHNKFI